MQSLSIRAGVLPYLFAFTLPLTVGLAFTLHGWWTFLPVLYIFGLLPTLEWLLPPDRLNPEPAEEISLKANPAYDWLLYAVVPIQYAFIAWFCVAIAEEGLSTAEITGRIIALGLMCGVFGINVAHELGHRSTPHEQFMAKALLLTSLYMHFFIEHNRGHHRHVATPLDPASARKGEHVYAFWLRSVRDSYWSAWDIQREILHKSGRPFWSLANEMLVYQFLQAGLLLLMGWLTSGPVMFAFGAAAVVGFLLLETVNYIEHYGLSRRQIPGQQAHYERVRPHHSWNSDHPIGRLMLFELSRHSDHHYIASRPYQLLRHHDHSPQLPTGYPGMMLLALIPPAWFAVMNPRAEVWANT